MFLRGFSLLVRLIFIVFLCIASAGIAQVSAGIWEGDDIPILDGEYGFNAVKNVPGNGYIFVGTKKISPTEDDHDIYVLRLDDNFEVMWSKLIGWENDDYGKGMELTRDGGFIMVGTSKGFKESGKKMLVLKLDAEGEIEWAKTVGHSGYSLEGNAIKPTPDGGYIAVGSTETKDDKLDVYIVKLDNAGNMEWDKIIGGLEDDEANAVDIGLDGGYIVAGYTRSAYRDRWNSYLIKLDAFGNLEWTSILDITNYTYANDIITIEEGYIVAGRSSYGYVAKFDPSGDIQWVNFAPSARGSELKKVLMGHNGKIYAFGDYSSRYYVVETDLDGSYWKYRWLIGDYQDFYYGFGMDKTDDGGYILTGNKRYRSTGTRRKFAHIIKTSSGFISCETPSMGNQYTSSPYLDRYSHGEIRDGGGSVSDVVPVVNEGPGLTDFCETVGIEDEQIDFGIKIYPNPSKGTFYLESANPILEIVIYNSINQKIYQSKSHSHKETVSTENFASGVYFVQIHTEKGLFQEKIVVRE